MLKANNKIYTKNIKSDIINIQSTKLGDINVDEVNNWKP